MPRVRPCSPRSPGDQAPIPHDTREGVGQPRFAVNRHSQSGVAPNDRWILTSRRRVRYLSDLGDASTSSTLEPFERSATSRARVRACEQCGRSRWRRPPRIRPPRDRHRSGARSSGDAPGPTQTRGRQAPSRHGTNEGTTRPEHNVLALADRREHGRRARRDLARRLRHNPAPAWVPARHRTSATNGGR